MTFSIPCGDLCASIIVEPHQPYVLLEHHQIIFASICTYIVVSSMLYDVVCNVCGSCVGGTSVSPWCGVGSVLM